MARTMKDCSIAKNSTNTATLFHETENLLKAADPQQVPQIILQLLQQLNGKVELHVHFIVNSNVISDNNATGGGIYLVKGNDNIINHQISKI
jgi:hypothetical protein